MKLLSFSNKSMCRALGAVLKDGRILHLSKNNEILFNGNMVNLIEETSKNSDSMLRLRDFISAPPNSSTIFEASEVSLEAPIQPIRNIMCIGKNYFDHIAEIQKANSTGASSDIDVPKHPMFFTKASTAVIGSGHAIERHAALTRWLDYEAELAVVIGKKCRDLTEENALEHVFGFTIANDVTARDVQKKHGQWFKGKSLDSFCPLGPVIVHRDDLNARDLSIKLWLNGEQRQASRTSQMIFSVPRILAELSRGMTLLPGDVILTGTPHGVGYAMNPPKSMETGDLVEIEVEGIGRLVNTVK